MFITKILITSLLLLWLPLPSSPRNLHINRHQQFTHTIKNQSLSIALSPSQVHTYLGYYMDIAIGTVGGKVHYYNQRYNYQYNSKGVNGDVRHMLWGKLGLAFVTNDTIKIVDHTKEHWVVFDQIFDEKIQNVVFGFDNKRNLLLLAVSFDSTLHLYENYTEVASFNISQPCMAMSYHSDGKLFSFFASVIDGEEEDSFFLHLMDTKTNKIIERSEGIQTNQKSIAFVYEPGYQHLSVSVDDESLRLWTNCTLLQEIKISRKVNQLLFTKNSQFLILNLGNELGSIKINLNRLHIIDSSSELQTQQFSSKIVDIAVNRNKVIILTSDKSFWVMSSQNKKQQSTDGLFAMMVSTFYIFFAVAFLLCFCSLDNGGIKGKKRVYYRYN